MSEFSNLEIKTGKTLLPFHPFGQALSLTKSRAALAAKLAPKILPNHSGTIFLEQKVGKNTTHASQGVFPNPRTIEVYHVIPLSVKLFLSMHPLMSITRLPIVQEILSPFFFN